MTLNPEFRRNLWLELSPHRLIAMPMILLAIFFLSASIGESGNWWGVPRASLLAYYVIVFFWGTRRAVASLADEVRGRTWDGQRMSALGTWAMTWGKLFGGTIYMLKRDVYFAVGGFPTSRDVDEDWELLLTVVARGHDLQVIPEPLLWYREREESRSRADNRFLRNRSRIELFERLLPVDLRDLASLAYGPLAQVQDAGTQRRLDRVQKILEKVQAQRMQGKPAKRR